MNISIKNFRGCASADVVLEKITLIAGENAAGKTSVAQAVAAALTGNPVPVRGVSKSTAGCLVRSGTAAGSVELVTDIGTTKIAYPKAAVNTEGKPPYASEFAAGLVCVLDLPPKERAETLSRYLKAEPTKEDLEARLAEIADLKPEHIAHIWQRVQDGGWDGAHAQAKEKGAKMKGQWEQITGERYGAKKADSWIPDGYSSDLDSASEHELQAALVDAREILEGCIAAEAVDEARIEALEKQASEIGTLAQQVTAAEKQCAELAAEVEKRKSALRELPPATSVSDLACPHCHKPVALVDNRLLPACEPLSAEEKTSRARAIASANDAIKIAQEDLTDSQRLASDLRGKLSTAERAAAELKTMASTPTEAVGDIEAARAAVSLAEQRVRCWKAKTEADDRHWNVGVNARILEALAPDGVRLDRLKKSLSAANKQLGRLDAVSLSDDLDASLNGTPYYLLSESEKYRVRVVLQVWMATSDGSAAVIIDGADLLVSKPLRNRLFKMLGGVGVPALVTMAFPSGDGVPDLSAHGMGASYWIGCGGVATPIGQP